MHQLIEKHAMPRLLPLLLLAALATGARAELYQWTDANGKVHFSDKAPGDGKAKVIPKPEATKTGGASLGPLDPVQAARRLELDKEKQARHTETLESRKRSCADARDDLQFWLDRQPYTINQQNGSKEYYNEPRHSQNLQRAQDRVDRNCRGL